MMVRSHKPTREDLSQSLFDLSIQANIRAMHPLELVPFVRGLDDARQGKGMTYITEEGAPFTDQEIQAYKKGYTRYLEFKKQASA